MTPRTERKSKLTGIVVLSAALLTLGACNAPGAGGSGTEKVGAAHDLLDFFARSCGADSIFAERALSQVKSLETTLKNLAKNDKCAGVDGLLSNVNDQAEKFKELVDSPATSARLRAQEKVRWLTSALALAQQTGDVTLANKLSLELIDAKVEQYEAEATENSSKREQSQERWKTGLTAASKYVDQLFSLQTNLAYCAEDNPFLPLQLATSAMAISGSFLRPELGSAVMMMGSALNKLVNYARTRDIGKGLYAFDSEKMDVALPCVLESIANTYCEAQDLLALLDFSNNGRNPPPPTRVEFNARFWQDDSDPFLRDIRLMAYKVPDLLAWVRKVAVGTTPNDSYSAKRIVEAKQQYFDFNTLVDVTEGVIRQFELQLSQPGANEASIVRGGLRKLVGTLCFGTMHTTDPNTCVSVVAADYGMAKLIYKLAQDGPPPGNTNEQRPTDLVEFKPSNIKWSMIAERARDILSQVRQRVTTQLTTYIISNASLLLSDAKKVKEAGTWEPLTVIGDLINFLYDSEEFHKKLGGTRGSAAVAEIQKTRDILERLASVILMWNPEKFDSVERAEEEAKKIIMELFDKLTLIYGETYLADRIKAHIRDDLINRMLEGQVPKSVQEILWAGGKDVIETLTANTGGNGTSLHDMRDSLIDALYFSEQSIKNFVQIFGLAFNRSMKRLYDNAIQFGERGSSKGTNQPNLNILSQMCILVLTTSPEWPTGLDQKMCEGLVYKSLYKEIADLKFDELKTQLDGKREMSERFCRFRDYRRKAELMRRNTGRAFP